MTGVQTCALPIFAEMGKSIIADDIPKFLVELGKMVSAQNMTYETWITDNHDRLEKLIEKYTD